MSLHMRVVIVDDEAEVRAAYAAFLVHSDDFVLVGEAADGRAAVTLFQDQHPDVMLMDLQMPVMSGEDAIREICEYDPAACILALTTFDTPDHVLPALNAGASGYLLKSCGTEQLTRALHEALSGQMPLSAEVRLALVNSVRSRSPYPAVSSPNLVTPREHELLLCLAEGLTNQQIAARLYLSPGSVKQYLSRLSVKLGVHTRTQILVTALQRGAIDHEAVGGTTLAPSETVNYQH